MRFPTLSLPSSNFFRPLLWIHCLFQSPDSKLLSNTSINVIVILSTSSMDYTYSSKLYPILGAFLFLATFGFSGIFVIIISLVAVIAGWVVTPRKWKKPFSFVYILYINGQQTAKDLSADFKTLGYHHRLRCGISFLLANRERLVGKLSYEQIHSMTGSAALDSELEQVRVIVFLLYSSLQILNYMIRDYVDSWYKNLTTDELFTESLKRTTRRSVAALSQR